MGICTVLLAALLVGSAAASDGAVYTEDRLVDGEFMRDWLLCGPFPNPLSDGSTEYFHDERCVGFFKDYLAPVGGEKGVKPAAGLEVPGPGGKARTWFAYHSPRNNVELGEVLKPSTGQAAYAACRIESPKDQARLFGLGSNDGVRVWLNGAAVWTMHMPRSLEVDDDYIRLPLKQGSNLLLLKVDNGGGRWGFVLRPMSDEGARKHLFENIDPELRFDFRLEGEVVKARFGNETSMAAVRGLPSARVKVLTTAGEKVRGLEMALGRAYEYPRKDYPAAEYLLEGVVTAPGGARITARGYFPAYDVIGAVRAMLEADLPEPPSSRAADAYLRLWDHLRWMDGVSHRLRGEPYAYRRLTTALPRLHTALEKLARESSVYDGLFPRPKWIRMTRGKTCVVNWTWSVSIQEGVQLERGLEALSRAWEEHFGMRPRAGTDAKGPTIFLRVSDTAGALTLPSAEATKTFEANPEAYVLWVTPQCVTILGRSPAGAFYGLDSFTQLLERSLQLPCAMVVDAPRYPLRAAYEPLCFLDSDFAERLRRYARLRYNTLFLPSADYLRLDKQDVRQNVYNVFMYCRGLFIEPVPYIETFGGSTIVLNVNRDLAEGVYREDEAHTIAADGSVRLPCPRILDTAHARPRVTDVKGRTLRRGQDYGVASKEPPVFRFEGGATPPGTSVRISYDMVDFNAFKFPASCPSDPEAWEIIDRVVGEIIALVKPRAFHIGQREAGYCNRCSRCRARGLSSGRLMADEIRTASGIVRRHGPSAKVYMWGDLFNPWQNGPLLGAGAAAQGIPKDVIVIDWWYGGLTRFDLDHLDQSFDYFHQCALTTAGAAWDDPFNVVHLAAQGARHPERFLGLVHTHWADRDGCLELTAQAAWEGETVLGEFAF